jgi:regulator of sirC expression with transglutaminase-like and TPR domain
MLTIPLELATWEQIIQELEDAETAIKGFPQTLAREEQFQFYHHALMQYRAFKNIFRNSVMHTRDSYDRDQAVSAVNTVRAFMQGLSTKIKEGSQTPWIWV